MNVLAGRGVPGRTTQQGRTCQTHLHQRVQLLQPSSIHAVLAATRTAPHAIGSSKVPAPAATNGSTSNGGTNASPSPSRPWKVPRSIHEVDNGQILGFGADLAEDHPGFHDEAYKQRRVDIANAARKHQIGTPIAAMEYTPEEVQAWGTALRELKKLWPSHACKEFLQSLPAFNFREDQVPQLQEVSEVLQRTTGWTIRPVAGLMHPRDFLNGLAFKYFHSTQYMRHPAHPSYTPEPDVIHELLGHAAMLADPKFSELVQAIGVASLHASEKDIWHLSKVYWYSVEFGVVREGGAIKAFGAGILSSFGELEHMAKGVADLTPLDPFQKQPKMSYKDGFQRRYFVLESFDEGAALLKDFAATHGVKETELQSSASVA